MVQMLQFGVPKGIQGAELYLNVFGIVVLPPPV
jgi:hypothetical protein